MDRSSNGILAWGMAALAMGFASHESQAALVDSMQARVFVNKTLNNKQIAYRLFVPRNYDKAKKYPIMVHLHGAGERGADNKNQLKNGISSLWARDSIQAKQPCFLLAPQCPSNHQWVDTDWGKGSYTVSLQSGQAGVPISDDLATVVAILDSLEKEFNLDKSRFYASGLSMGGYGTWDLVTRYPNRFAAAVPICGAGDPSKAARLAALPLYVFHGDGDATVPVAGSRDMINAIQSAGGHPIYKEIKGRGHDSWIDAEKEAGLADWVFAQSLAPVSIMPRQAKGRGGLYLNPDGGFGGDGLSHRLDTDIRGRALPHSKAYRPLPNSATER